MSIYLYLIKIINGLSLTYYIRPWRANKYLWDRVLCIAFLSGTAYAKMCSGNEAQSSYRHAASLWYLIITLHDRQNDILKNLSVCGILMTTICVFLFYPAKYLLLIRQAYIKIRDFTVKWMLSSRLWSNCKIIVPEKNIGNMSESLSMKSFAHPLVLRSYEWQ